MKYKIYIFAIIFSLILSSCAGVIAKGSINKDKFEPNQLNDKCNEKILYVGGYGPENYTRIQDAINDAYNGYTVFIFNGTYDENLIIDKRIKLIGKDKENTIINGSKKGNIIRCEESFIEISNLTIKNSGDTNFPSGIIVLSKNVTIKNNIFKNNYNGLYCSKCYDPDLPTGNITIMSNLFVDNTVDISFFSPSSKNNTICKNKFLGGSYLNQNLETIFLFNFEKSKIYKNEFIGNHDLVLTLISSDNNLVYENIINSNFKKGIELREESKNNKIFKNEIKNNDKDSNSFGLDLSSSIDNKISENIIQFCSTGLYSKENPNKIESRNNIINKNTISNCKSEAIYLKGSKNNIISKNNIDSSNFGIILAKKSNENNIYLNDIENINIIGILIDTSNRNTISANNFKKCNLNEAAFIKSSFNKWRHNYWERPRILPKIINGYKGINGLIHWINIDPLPAKIPNKINI